MSAHDDIEPLGRDDTAPTVEELEALDRADQRQPRDDPADARFVADMAPALDGDLRNPADRRRVLNTYARAERRRRTTVRRRRGGTP